MKTNSRNVRRQVVAAVMLLALAGGMPLSTSSQMVPTPAQGNPLEPIARGVEAWKTSGFQAGARAWTAGGPMYTGHREANLVKQLQDINKYYGKAVDYRLLGQRDAGTVNRIYYVVVNLEQGAMFARFVNSLRKGSWRVSDLKISTAPEDVIPHWVFEHNN